MLNMVDSVVVVFGCCGHGHDSGQEHCHNHGVDGIECGLVNFSLFVIFCFVLSCFSGTFGELALKSGCN